MSWRLLFQSKTLWDPDVLAPELEKLDVYEEGVEIEHGGRFVAALLEAQLPSRDFPISFVMRVDWGWCVCLDNPGFYLSIGCGYSSEGDYGLHCFVTPERPRIWHFFKRAAVAKRIADLKQTIEDILRESGQVSDLHWHEDPR